MPETDITFTNKGSRYLFCWSHYTAEVSKIKTARDTTICQFIVSGNGNIPFRTRLNLESDRARSNTAKELSTRFKSSDWKEILEHITNKTLEEFEKGEPVSEIHSSDEIPELEYLISPLFPLGKPTILFGDPGCGKSQLAVVTNILTVFSDWDNNPLRLIPPKKSMRGLVLDWEADKDDWQRQLKWFTDAFNLGYATIFHRRCSLSLAHELDAIKAHIEEMQADYVIIDSVSLAAGGDLNHMDIATSYFRAVRQLTYPDGRPLTTISLAHTSKDRDAKGKTILGSVLFEAGARNVWEVRGEKDGLTLDIGLFHRKSNLTRIFDPLGFHIEYQEDPKDIRKSYPVSMTWRDPQSVEEFVERMNTTTRILNLLAGRQLTDAEISTQLNLNLSNIRMALSRLKKKDLILKIGEKWAKAAIVD